MANDLRTEPLLATAGLTRREQEAPGYPPGRGRHHGSASPYAAYPPSGPPQFERGPGDVASIFGLPETLVTPAVLTAVSRILGELDQARWRENQLRQRLAMIESEAHHHPAAPVLNQSGFLLSLDEMIANSGLGGTLVMLHIEGLERVRRCAGLAAGTAALRHLSAAIVTSLRASDPLGLLDDSDFAFVLVGTSLEPAQAKLAELTDRLNQPPFAWEGLPYPFVLHAGFHLIDPADTAETALFAADLDRRGRDKVTESATKNVVQSSFSGAA